MAIYNVNGNIIPTGGSSESQQKFPWLNIAHKGTAPEQYGNSIYAFNRSHTMGFDGVETDVRMTADNIVVLSHDADVVGKDANGNTQTVNIATSNYSDFADLTLFTIDNVDYHVVRLDDFLRMAFNWGWFVQLDHKSQSNTTSCIIKCSELVRDNGMSGKVSYIGWVSNVSTILSNDPLANFDVSKSTVIEESDYANIPVERLWFGVKRQNLPTDISELARNRPMYVWDVGSAQASYVMEYRPNMIQWTGNTDGVSLSETYLANLHWS